MPKTPKKPDVSKPNNYRAYQYDGVSADKVKGVLKVYEGPLYQGHLPWPSDIAKFYEGKL